MKKISTNRKTLSLFWEFTKPNPVLFWWGTIGAVIATFAADILPPLVIAGAFNKIQSLTASGSALDMSELSIYLLAYVGLVISSIVLWRTQAYCVWKYIILSEQRIYERLFNHIQYQGSRFHADRFGGALVSQANRFASAYDRFMSDFTWNMVNGITALIASLFVLYLTSPLFAGAFSVVALIYLAIMYRLMKKQAPLNRAVAASESKRTAALADTITNIATVRAFAGENTETKLFSRQAKKTTNANLNLMHIQMRNEALSQIGTNVLNVLAFSIGIFAITRFNAPVGSLYLMVTYTMSLTNRLWQSMFVMRNVTRVFGDATEMTEILQIEPEIKDPENPEESRIHRGGIVFKDVSYNYSDGKKKLFEDLNFRIKPGEKVGLVGHSGGGKTTVTKLILRFMDINEGEITIDDQNITHINQRELRSHIAYVPQEPLLFHRSLAENISYGNEEAGQKEIEATAKMAHAHEFIKDLSDGYDTLVGERGIKLSGGQRQRVAIARAMLRNAPILVLDEATSALDSESEAYIQDALWKLMEGRTAIVIAHRLSTVQKMDRILVMDKGKIVEEGTHKELLNQKGIYASLWSRQSGGFLK